MVVQECALFVAVGKTSSGNKVVNADNGIILGFSESRARRSHRRKERGVFSKDTDIRGIILEPFIHFREHGNNK